LRVKAHSGKPSGFGLPQSPRAPGDSKLTQDSNFEGGPTVRAQGAQQSGKPQPSEPSEGTTLPNTATQSARVNVLVMQIRNSRRNEQQLGHVPSLRDLIDEGRR